MVCAFVSALYVTHLPIYVHVLFWLHYMPYILVLFKLGGDLIKTVHACPPATADANPRYTGT